MSADETRAVIVNAIWKDCVSGGGWWIANDADGKQILLAPDGFVDELPRTDLTPPAADYVAGLEAALRDTRETVLSLINHRYSEAEGPDEDWVGVIDAALAARPASPDTRVTDTILREAIARAWCHEENVAKEMDVDLAEAVLSEISTIIIGGQDRG